MHKLVFQMNDGEVVPTFAARGENLLELARRANVPIDAPCTGNLSCGKCKIRLLSGELSSGKNLHLDDVPFQQSWRVAAAAA